jgi:hypothetical protein
VQKIEDCRKLGAVHSPNGKGGCYYCRTEGVTPFTLSKPSDVEDQSRCAGVDMLPELVEPAGLVEPVEPEL